MPSPNPTVRRQHAGNALTTTLSAAIVNGTDTTFTLVAATGWPDGSVGNFVVTINAGLSDVEKILCSTRTGTTVNVVTRGFDGTTSAGHALGATVTHTISALEIDEVNQHTNATGAVHGVAGTVVGTTDAQALTNKTMSGASNTFSAIPQSATHTSPDTDTATTALHHTLGTGANQAASGTHTHTNTTGASLQTQTLTSGSGNWTVPTGVTQATVTVIAGGGGAAAGGGTSSTGFAAGGGGQVIRRLVTGLTPGGTVAYGVGAGGAVGTAGGNSTFGSLTAVGGGGGSGTSTAGNYAADGTNGSWPGCAGAGGSGVGGRGHVGVLGYAGGGGGGGGTSGPANNAGGAATDGGGAGGAGNTAGTGGAGTAGTANTGGGGGGGGGGTPTAGVGAAGGSGVVIIEWVA